VPAKVVAGNVDCLLIALQWKGPPKAGLGLNQLTGQRSLGTVNAVVALG
jgi:hypothetical protein